MRCELDSRIYLIVWFGIQCLHEYEFWRHSGIEQDLTPLFIGVLQHDRIAIIAACPGQISDMAFRKNR